MAEKFRAFVVSPAKLERTGKVWLLLHSFVHNINTNRQTDRPQIDSRPVNFIQYFHQPLKAVRVIQVNVYNLHRAY